MANKRTILETATFDDFGAIYRRLRQPDMRQTLTRGQIETLADVIDHRLPAYVMLEQRTPKNAIYVHVGGAYIGKVTQSAAIEFARRPARTAQPKPPTAPPSGSAYEIENGVPYSSVYRRYPFAAMRAGDTVLIPCADMVEESKARRAAYAAARYRNWTMRTSAVGTGIRVWRIA